MRDLLLKILCHVFFFVWCLCTYNKAAFKLLMREWSLEVYLGGNYLVWLVWIANFFHYEVNIKCRWIINLDILLWLSKLINELTHSFALESSSIWTSILWITEIFLLLILFDLCLPISTWEKHIIICVVLLLDWFVIRNIFLRCIFGNVRNLEVACSLE